MLSSRSESARRSSPRRRAIRAGLTSRLSCTCHWQLRLLRRRVINRRSRPGYTFSLLGSNPPLIPPHSRSDRRGRSQRPSRISQHLSSTETRLQESTPPGSTASRTPVDSTPCMSPAGSHGTGPRAGVPARPSSTRTIEAAVLAGSRAPTADTTPPSSACSASAASCSGRRPPPGERREQGRT